LFHELFPEELPASLTLTRMVGYVFVIATRPVPTHKFVTAGAENWGRGSESNTYSTYSDESAV